MARREFQDPPLKTSTGRRPFYYVRVYIRVLTGKGKVGKKYHRERLGWCHEIGLREASRRRANYLKKINGEAYALQSQIPFGEFAAIWLEKHVNAQGNLGAGTRSKYQGHLNRHILPVFGPFPLCEVDTEKIDSFLTSKAEAGLSWWTRSDLRNILSSIFTKASDWGYWPEGLANPVEKSSLGRKRAKREKRIQSDDNVRALLERVPPRISLLVRLADSSGLRISEILGLRWQDVDLVTGWIAVKGRWYRGDYDDTKTETSHRRVPLGCLLDELKAMQPIDRKPDDYVFTRNDGSGEPMWDSGIRKQLKKAARSIGVDFEGFGMHSFRRESNTKLQEVGATAIEAQKHLGHAKPTMTAEYTVLQRQRHEELVRRLQNRLFGDDNSSEKSREQSLIDKLEKLLAKLEGEPTATGEERTKHPMTDSIQ